MTKCTYSVSKVESIEIKPTVISKACTNLNAAARAGGLGQLTRFNGSDTGGGDDAGEHCASGGSGVPRLVGQGTRLHARSHVHVRTRVRHLIPPSSQGTAHRGSSFGYRAGGAWRERRCSRVWTTSTAMPCSASRPSRTGSPNATPDHTPLCY